MGRYVQLERLENLIFSGLIMAQTSHRHPVTIPSTAVLPVVRSASWRGLALRRLLAWSLEFGILASSIVVPWSMGELARRQEATVQVPLNPMSRVVQGIVARAVGLPKSQLVETVPPLTNGLWFMAIVLPTALVGGQLYSLARTGKTWPKAWLGLRVIHVDGSPPGLQAVLIREVVGRWGLPLAASYGLWIGCGAFANLPVLGGLALLCLLAEGMTGQTNASRRAFHDYLASTKVIWLKGGQMPVKYRPSDDPDWSIQDAYARLPNRHRQMLAITQEKSGGLTSIVLAPVDQGLDSDAPWPWQRYARGVGLGILGGAVVLLAMAGLGLSRRQPVPSTALGENSDDLFLALVENLSLNADSFTDKQAAALALASTQDPRGVTLLVDMLAQTGDPALMETIQQALVTIGPAAIPHLQRLNLTLANDVLALPPDQKMVPLMRQRTVKRTLAKILLLHSGSFEGIDLNGTNLGYVIESPDAFTLVLEQRDLAGIEWRNAILTGARFRKSEFYAPGEDQRLDTFDDWITDFRGSDLTEASFVAAQLRHVDFRNTSLLRANLSNSQAHHADFSGANASSARFIEAVLDQARLERTSLVGADLTNAQLSQANLVEARLKQATLIGTQLDRADLTRADLSEADFQGASLRHGTLAEANFSQSDLQDADLSHADLTNANFQNADLQNVVLTGANLANANFAGAVFYVAENRQPDAFITTTQNLTTDEAFYQVDFSQAQNLDNAQLQYICMQGGIHPACR
jgi:uncharacterized protein YjbI with pentapeptide repeats/uncharacterized RDD family membrane protein YckC